MLADWNRHLVVDLDEPPILEEHPAMVMDDQCGVHCNFHHIMKCNMAHVHHIFARGHQSSVVQILDKDAYKELTGAWKDELCHPRHKKKHLANKHRPAMLK